jgi:hypothetical protein
MNSWRCSGVASLSPESSIAGTVLGLFHDKSAGRLSPYLNGPTGNLWEQIWKVAMPGKAANPAARRFQRMTKRLHLLSNQAQVSPDRKRVVDREESAPRFLGLPDSMPG